MTAQSTSVHWQSALIEPGPANRLVATLGLERPALKEGDLLPPAWHWLYFLSAPPASDLSADGRGAAGDLVPDFPGQSRMWAGGSFDFGSSLRIGTTCERHSRLVAVTPKTGNSGPLTVADVEHVCSGPAGARLTERQTIIFRPQSRQLASAGERAARVASWRHTVHPDTVLLFRFSALIFNAHRIHYDLPYARDVEGYPGLLVHAPLTCLLLLDLAERHMPDRQLTRFHYRAQRPLFCDKPLSLFGAPTASGATLWAEDDLGFIGMTAEAIVNPIS